MKARQYTWLAPAILLLVLLAVWQAVTTLWPQETFYLGNPAGVAGTIYRGIASGELPLDFAVTLLETITGFAVGVCGGVLLGIALWALPLMSAALRPYIVGMGIVPPFALAPLFIYWSGIGFTAKVAIASFSAFSFAALAAARGARRADEDYRDLRRLLRPLTARYGLKVVFPASLAEITTTLRVSVSFCLSGVFIGEVISSEAGLGHFILVNMGLFRMSAVLAGVVGLALVAIVCDGLARAVGKALSWAASLV